MKELQPNNSKHCAWGDRVSKSASVVSPIVAAQLARPHRSRKEEIVTVCHAALGRLWRVCKRVCFGQVKRRCPLPSIPLCFAFELSCTHPKHQDAKGSSRGTPRPFCRPVPGLPC